MRSVVQLYPGPPLCRCHNGVAGYELRGLSSAGRAVALQASGRRFDPDRLHHRPSIQGRVSSFGDDVSDAGSIASKSIKHREKGICLGPREREPIGHLLQPRLVLGSSQNDLVFSSMLFGQSTRLTVLCRGVSIDNESDQAT